jgi:hypothetical protein
MNSTETPKKKPIYDTDITKPIPVLIEEVRSKLVNIRGNLNDIGYCLGWKDRFEDVIGLLTCGLVVLHGIKEEIEKAEDKWRKEKEDRGELPKSYRVSARPLGADNTPGCFVCGGENGLHSNISMFVVTKEDGEAVTALFKTGARLDYRDYEPNWIQVKVGSCKEHYPNLELLHSKVSAYPHRITEQVIQEAMGGK